MLQPQQSVSGEPGLCSSHCEKSQMIGFEGGEGGAGGGGEGSGPPQPQIASLVLPKLSEQLPTYETEQVSPVSSAA